MCATLAVGPKVPLLHARILRAQLLCSRLFQSRGVVLAAITICGALLRLWNLGAKSFWVDEAFSAVLAAAPWQEFWRQVQAAELNMVPYYLLLRIWIHFGSSEAWLRLLSALFAIATIPAIYVLASRLFNRRVGLLSAGLLAVNPGHVRFAQEARSYSLTVLLLTVFAIALVHALRDDKKLYWLACAVSGVMAAYSHFFAVFACIAQIIGVGVQPVRQHLRAVIVSSLTFGLLVIPIGLFALNHDVGQLSGVMHPHFRHLLGVFFLLTGNGPRFVLYLLLWVIAGWQSFRIKIQRPNEPAISCAYSFLLTWLLLPLLVAVALSYWKAALLPRYLLVSLPAAVILGAAGAAQLPEKFRALIIVLLVALSLKSVAAHYHRPNQDWRSAIQYVLAHSRSGDAISMMPASSAAVFDYYGVLRNAQSPQLRSMTVGTLGPTAQKIWVVTISKPLKLRAQSRKIRWQEAEADLEHLLTVLGPTYTVSEVHNYREVRVLLLTPDRTLTH